MNVTMIVCYFVVAVVLFSFAVYALGREWAEEGDESDPSGLAMLAFFASAFWLPVVVLGIVIMPFVLLYHLGKRQGKTALEKKKMWETLGK